MSFLTTEEIVALRASNPQVRIYTYSPDEYEVYRYTRVPDGPLSPVQASDIIDAIKAATLAHRNTKINRPWMLVNLTEKLDPEQPWLGFELECGWENSASYTSMVNHVLDNMHHTVIDPEGQGTWSSEITFPPENYDSYADGTAQIQKLYDFVADNKLRMIKGLSGYCGTHVNISTPAYRRAPASMRAWAVSLINTSLFLAGRNSLVKMFGRVPYNVGFCRNDTLGNYWIEYKLFQSTADKEQFQSYVNVSKNIAALVEYLLTNQEKLKQHGGTISTIWNIENVLLQNCEPVFFDIRWATHFAPTGDWNSGDTIRNIVKQIKSLDLSNVD